MASAQKDGKTVFRVIDALDAPHGGRILRLRLQEGSPPRVGDLKGARLDATSPSGDRRTVRVTGFPVFGGKPTDERLARSGRIDVHVEQEGDGEPVSLRWSVTPS